MIPVDVAPNPPRAHGVVAGLLDQLQGRGQLVTCLPDLAALSELTSLAVKRQLLLGMEQVTGTRPGLPVGKRMGLERNPAQRAARVAAGSPTQLHPLELAPAANQFFFMSVILLVVDGLH